MRNAAACTSLRATESAVTQSAAEPPMPAAALHAAVVHSPDGVRFAAAGLSRVELVRRLAEYVGCRSSHTLWARDARHVQTLLARGELEAAVEVYFGRVGGRWDPEWLVNTAITTVGGLAAAG